MTNPTAEDAMEQLRASLEIGDALDIEPFLATIRKHIEDQDEAIDHLVEALSVERAAALITIEELQGRIEELEKQQTSRERYVQDVLATIEFQRRRVVELEHHASLSCSCEEHLHGPEGYIDQAGRKQHLPELSDTPSEPETG